MFNLRQRSARSIHPGGTASAITARCRLPVSAGTKRAIAAVVVIQRADRRKVARSRVALLLV